MKTFLLFLCLALAGCVEDKPDQPLKLSRLYTVTIYSGNAFRTWKHVKNYGRSYNQDLAWFDHAGKTVLISGTWSIEEE